MKNRLKKEAKPVNKRNEKKSAVKKKGASGNKKKSVKPKKNPGNNKKIDVRVWRIAGFLLILFSIYLLLSFFSFFVNWFKANPDTGVNQMFHIAETFKDHTKIVESWTGKLGGNLADIFIRNSFGLGAFFIAFALFEFGVRLLFKLKTVSNWRFFELSVLSLLWLPLLAALIFPENPVNIIGGNVGHQLHLLLSRYMGLAGEVLILIFTVAIFTLIDIQFNFHKKKKKEEKSLKTNFDSNNGNKRVSEKSEDIYNTVEFSVEEDDETKKGENDKNKVDLKDEGTVDLTLTEADIKEKDLSERIKENVSDAENIELTVEHVEPDKEVDNKKVNPGDHFGVDTEFDPRLDLPDYKFPPLDLLEKYDDGNVKVEREELEANKRKIVETLKNYNIGISQIKATIGPTVTLYEIVPAPGVRISKIKNLEDDIALSLSAIGIRIIAPIPGKGTVGIEVPNKNPTIVSMRSVLSSEKFQNSTFELPLALGKTISNTSFVVDLAKMPHILMAGATGQGKSVGLNAIISSLLYKKHPAELKFVLVDPKKVELTLYSKIERHFLAKLPDSEESIITDTRKVVRTLNSLSIEMDNRYELLKDAQVRNIKEYNAKFKKRKLNPVHGHRFLPYIVLIVDEFADLIMTAGKEVEGPITRLAQLARAVGIHLVIATQRPSVNIITGTIKANFPARIAFRVISKIDSRTILDASGADQLIGRGDMLLSTGSDLIRLQCAFIDTPEVERVTDYIGSQRGYPDAMHLPEYEDEEAEMKKDFDNSDRDPLFEDAARIIVQTQQGSTSLLQRKLKLGYNRAGRIIDQLEAAGIVGPFEGSKAREVKIANEMALEQFLKDLNMDNKNNDNY